jgi:hypothetical protein
MGVKTTVESMGIGDVIPCRCTVSNANTPAVFSELGTCVADEIPLSGTDTPNGLFYFIKADKGLLIADRVVQTGVSWDTLSTAGYVDGVTPLRDPVVVSPTNMTSYTAPSPYVVSCDSNYVYDYGWKAFQANKAGSRPFWYNTITIPSGGHWLKIYMGSNTRVSQVAFSSLNASGTGTGTAKNFEVYGSYNNASWDLIYKGVHPNAAFTMYTYKFNEVNYPWYRINLLDGYYGSAIGIWGIEYRLQEPGFNTSAIVRSLSGGNSYLGTDSKSSLTEQNLGAWPTNNEWSNYIVNSDLDGTIVPGDDAIWHWKDTVFSWCKDTSISGFISAENGTANSSWRAARGDHPLVSHVVNDTNGVSSSLANQYIGFRPVLEYPEDPNCTNLWY